MSTIDKTISALQSRVTRRGTEIADLEQLYAIQHALAYTKRQFKVAKAIRQSIKPLAIDQKLDRRILRTLTDRRTSERRNAEDFVEFVAQHRAPLFAFFEDSTSVGDIRQINKFSFPG